MANELDVRVYAPPLVGDVDRALAVVHGFERAFSGVQLAWKISSQGPVALRRRTDWIAAAVRSGKFPLLCNGDESYPVTLGGFELSWRTPGELPLTDFHAQMPLDAAAVAAATDVLEAMGDGARAFWGDATPLNAAAEIANQTLRPNEKNSPPRGLPGLRVSYELPSPEIPYRLGWLNYWSAATAKLLGFPDPSRDADLLARSRRTAAGAWVVKLTDAPLDLDLPHHVDALRRVYDRFPLIGGRSLP